MKKWIAGASLLVAAVALVAAFQTRAEPVRPDESLVKLFPREAEGLAFVDVSALKATPLFKDALDRMERRPRALDEFSEKTGFVIERDLDRLMIGKVNAREYLAVGRATFDRLKVEQFLEDKGFSSERYLGRMVYHPKREQPETEQEGTVSFVDGIVLLGHTALVKQAIDRLAAPAPNALDNAKLIESIRAIEAGSQVWGVGDFSADMVPSDARIPPAAVELLKSLHHGTYQMRLGTDVAVRATGDFRDAEAARNTTDLLRGLVAAAKLHVAKNQDMIRLLDGVAIQSSGSSVGITFQADGELLKKLQQSRNVKLKAEQ